MREPFHHFDDVTEDSLVTQRPESLTPHLVFSGTISNPKPPIPIPPIPIPVPKPPAKRAQQAAEGYLRFLWLTAVLLVMVGLRYLVPWFAEEVQYSITRGRERAEFEQASKNLGKLPIADLSVACQLISKRIGPSVVHINVAGMKPVSADNDDQEPFPFRHKDFGSPSGQGSGVIIDVAGYILTNNHVVQGATEIEVGLSDGRRVPAQLIGMDLLTDLAVLKIEADELTAAQWGDSDSVEVGALVWAAGSPFGLQRTVTFGILSAKHRAGIAGNPYQDFLQTDAAVNPGNSGGPLVDDYGRVIGINTAIVGEVYQGVSFAVPSHVAREVYERLVHEGRVPRGWLGVQMNEVSQLLADQLGLKNPTGAFVEEIMDFSPAKSAGIRVGDVITKWNNDDVDTTVRLRQLVAGTRIGTQATVTIFRNGQSLDLHVAVGERPPD